MSSSHSPFLAHLPAPIAAVFDDAEPPLSGEEELWLWVVLRAVLDAVGECVPLNAGMRKDITRARIIAESRSWWCDLENTADRNEVLDLSGLDGARLVVLMVDHIDHLESAGVVEMPVTAASRIRAQADMPGATFEAVYRVKPFTVEKVRRRLSRAQREQCAVVHSYLIKDSLRHDRQS